MERSLANLTQYREDVAEQSYLVGLCGTEERFRDRYELLKTLGRGGFGITFLARDMQLPGSPTCVIKQLCPKVMEGGALQQARRRFEQEARILSKLGSHAQVPRLLDYFEQDGEFFLIQEYVRGLTLLREVKRSGPFSELQVKRFLLEFLPLLQYVHNNHVIHRDIKPPNIIRCRDDGRLVLIDFGAVKERIAQVADSCSVRPSTTQFVGTLGFAPPEQLASRPVFSSDIYALGVTCLYLLTGNSPTEFDYEFLSGEIRWQNEVTVSDHLGNILVKMLKVSPRDRYQSAMEILRALQLEPYLDNLVYCMNINPKPFPNAKRRGMEPNPYLPPIARTAASIRDWRAKLKARHLRGDHFNPPITFSNSTHWK
jgi:serine/threonine-protein kinase